MMWWFGYPGGLGIGAIVLMFVFWAAIIGLIVWGVLRLTRSQGGQTANKKDALDIAKERYAKGEITKEQFEQIKKDLQN
jgi:putative membrane protein